jgi:hypothetical protein
MNADEESFTNAYESAKGEGIKTLLQASLVYSLKTRSFDDENYYVEDVTSVVETYQKKVLQIIDELIDTSFALMKKFEDQYTSK